MQKEIAGLSEKEVLRRQKSAQGNLPQSITKSRKKIIYDNVCTLFNFLNLLIAVMLFSVKAYSNLVFIGIIVLNVLIGIAQEWKAKKLVDELSILNRPVVSVRREGKNQQVSLEDVVKGDVLVLESGSQICNDSVVIEGGIEVNESLLTGESDAVIKENGAELFSGSFVISGKAYAKVTHVGNENYATKLANEVKKEKKVSSELLGSMQKITRFTSFLIIPMGILLLLEALFIRHTEVRGAVISSSAALLGMLPKGMVLLISVSLAAGVIRLAKMKILVQNIYSLETLAHVDTLCLDKTGTITDGKLKVYSVIVTLFCLISNIPFPFIPIQITLIDAFIEAYPSFLTIIESDTRQIEGSFLKTALSRAFPFGVAVSGVIVAISLLHPFSVEQRETVMYLILVLLSMIAVIQSCIPFNLLRVFICVTMAVGIAGALVILPNFFFVAKVSFSMGIYLVNVVAVALACILAFQCFEDKRHSAF